MKKYIITEGVESTFHYHLSDEKTPTRSLCGKWVMHTDLPMDTWGMVTHLHERYCSECYGLHKKDSPNE